jgi:hypothetical protein
LIIHQIPQKGLLSKDFIIKPTFLSDYQSLDNQDQEPNNQINESWKESLIGVLGVVVLMT